jgi:uncharacterized membrane protein HdeD (DUF308 family)
MTSAGEMLDGHPVAVLGRIWWAVLLKASGALLFAIAAIFWVSGSLPALSAAFAAYTAADGLFSIIGAVRGGGLTARVRLALAGLASLGAAAATALLPAMTSPNLSILIGGWR